ncbi:receiver/sensor box histidine kinase [Haloarchaeobius amylolyticus]|uniref:receiver/sensor box histidine kinase n=1 Tax=Haloarchaeobius amylolyticus TaxID=1198296 RepID=UPI0022700D89|nr:GAF domain-containing protein [Haloarchaeobius amylolyticus]
MSESGETAPRVSIVAGGDEFGSVLASAVTDAGGEVAVVDVPDSVTSREQPPDCVVVTDHTAGDDRLGVVRQVRSTHPSIPVVFVARDGDEYLASDAIQAGVADYVPFDDGETDPAAVASRVLDAATAAAAAGDEENEALARRERALREAYDIAADMERPFEDRVADLLHVVRETVGTDYATLSRVHDDDYVFESIDAPTDADLEAGDVIPLEATNCERVVETERTLVLDDVERDAPELADKSGNADWGISCYLGAPVIVGGEPYGTFCFYDTEAREEAFSEWQVTFVDIFADWVSYELERQRNVDRLRALDELNGVVRAVTGEVLGESTRAGVEETACRSLVSTETYDFAWLCEVDDTGTVACRAASTPEGSHAAPSRPPFPDEDSGPVDRAHRTGEVQVARNVTADGLQDGGADHEWAAIAAVPIVYEGECFGVLTVTTGRGTAFDEEERHVLAQFGEILGLSIAAIEHQQQVRNERERLEFMNRIIRHNLLNGMNVVLARAELLDGHVDETMVPHLETVVDRIEDMIDLIETIQAFMQAIVHEGDHELEPVRLDEVLREETAQAKASYTDATFETGEFPVVEVVGDDLLPEVFENLLTNAVQHNDKETPVVRVTARETDEGVEVRVADNGPGVEDDLAGAVFEKGSKGFASPGTGFGLYLVREMVESYGGDIDLQTGDLGGATFVVTLPRA